MITNKFKSAFTSILTVLLAILFVAAGMFMQIFTDKKGGRIADGIDLPFVMEPICVLAGQNVITAPVIEDVSLEGISGAVRPDTKVRVCVKLNQSTSVKGAGVVFKNITSGAMISAGGDDTGLTEGKYIELAIPKDADGGLYVIERMVLKDDRMNTHIYYNPDIYDSDYMAASKNEMSEAVKKISFTVLNENQDKRPPEFYSYEIEKEDVASGEEILFAVEAADVSEKEKDVYNNDIIHAGSGLESIKVNWERIADEGDSSILKQYSFCVETSFADMNKSKDVYHGTFKVPAACISGKYAINNIQVEDKSGNRTVYVNKDIYKGADNEDNAFKSAVELDEKISSIYMDVSGKTVSGEFTKNVYGTGTRMETGESVSMAAKAPDTADNASLLVLISVLMTAFGVFLINMKKLLQ